MATSLTPTETTSGEEVARRTIILRLRLGSLGVNQKISSRDVLGDQSGLVDGQAVDEELVHVSKEIIKADELRAVKRIEANVRAYLINQSYPVSFLRGGMYLMALGSVDAVEARLDEFKAERLKRIATFISVYPELKQESKRRLGRMWNPADYPSAEEVEQAFTWYREWVAFRTPETLKSVSEFLYQRESRKLEARFTEAAEEIKLALRSELLGLIEYLSERLSSGPEDKKVIRASKVERLVDFLQTFPARNVTDDDELTALVARLRGMLVGVDAGTLKTNERTRERVRVVVDEVKSVLGDLVDEGPARLIRLANE